MKKAILLIMAIFAITLVLESCTSETQISEPEVVTQSVPTLNKETAKYYELLQKVSSRNGGTGMICSITDDYMHRRVYMDDYGNYYLSFHSIGSPFEFTRKLDDFNEVEKFCTDRDNERTESYKLNKEIQEVERIAKLSILVLSKSKGEQSYSSRDDGFSIICSGSTPPDNIGYQGSEHTVWQDRYGTYYFTLKSGGTVQTVRLLEQNLDSAYHLC